MENLLDEMRRYAEEYHVPIIRDEAAKILCAEAHEKNPQHILEIGTAIGYSTLLLANSAKKAQITTLELSAERSKVACSYFVRSTYNERIKLFTGDAAKTIKSLNKKFDFVFIDAAKGQYPRYLKEILPILTTDAVIAADNVLFRGYVYSEAKLPRRYKTIVKRLRKYIALLEENREFITKIYDKGDGLAVSRRRSKDEESRITGSSR